MATDFRDGKTFPRPGRLKLGPYMWLARVADKGRAAAAGTIFDYIYPCPMDLGVFERWGVTPAEFDAALARHADDDALLAWLSARTDASHAEAANAWLTGEKSENLDRQDREELGVA
ncbi:MAG TPA: DUF5069 domain-containing protein [Candidatus Baltobacteraceae bacterium]|jgi:hypothetical protein